MDRTRRQSSMGNEILDPPGTLPEESDEVKSFSLAWVAATCLRQSVSDSRALRSAIAGLIELFAHNALKNLARRRSREAVRKGHGFGNLEPSNLVLTPFDQLLLGQ